jgi:ATP-dependent Zn protease
MKPLSGSSQVWERKSRILNPIEKKIVAYHEVGHAIVGTLMPGANRVEKISIVREAWVPWGTPYSSRKKIDS